MLHTVGLLSVSGLSFLLSGNLLFVVLFWCCRLCFSLDWCRPVFASSVVSASAIATVTTSVCATVTTTVFATFSTLGTLTVVVVTFLAFVVVVFPLLSGLVLGLLLNFGLLLTLLHFGRVFSNLLFGGNFDLSFLDNLLVLLLDDGGDLDRLLDDGCGNRLVGFRDKAVDLGNRFSGEGFRAHGFNTIMLGGLGVGFDKFVVHVAGEGGSGRERCGEVSGAGEER